MNNKKNISPVLSIGKKPRSEEKHISEDKKDRQERRQERREKRFEEKGNLKAFIQNLETLKSQIISNVVDTDHWINQNPNSKVYPKYRKTFLDLLERVAKTMGDSIYISKKEGNKIGEKDQELLLGLLDNYNGIKKEYSDASEKYSNESTQEIIAAQKELKFKDISIKLVAAAKYFQEASEENIKLLDTLKSKSTPAEETKTTDEIQIDSPIKKGAGSKKSPNEKVREVQKLILDKFKNNKDVTATEVWKNFARFKPDGIFGNATSSIITPIKAGFEMSEKTTDITQEFINKLLSIKESLLESKQVLGFFDFLKINENFNIDAFKEEASKFKITQKEQKPEEQSEIVIDEEKMMGIKEMIEGIKGKTETDISLISLKAPHDKGGKSLKIKIKKRDEEDMATVYVTPMGKLIIKTDKKQYTGTLNKSLDSATFNKIGRVSVKDLVNNPLLITDESIESKMKNFTFNIFRELSKGISFGRIGKSGNMFYEEIKKIKSKKEFIDFEKYFGSMKINKSDVRNKEQAKLGWKNYNFDKIKEKNKDRSDFLSLRDVIKTSGQYFGSAEIARLNSSIPSGVDKF
jgi:ribosomal protein L20A (L18A)